MGLRWPTPVFEWFMAQLVVKIKRQKTHVMIRLVYCLYDIGNILSRKLIKRA